jgi:REP element-mobilizing transposase RayT
MAEPLAYFLTWTTYGTWLPGDERGWVHHSGKARGISRREGEPSLKEAAERALKTSPVVFSPEDRTLVESQIRETCRFRGWTIHALEVRTNHIHIVLTARNAMPEKAMDDLKAWGTRALNQRHGKRPSWWTRGGSKRWINTDDSLATVIQYVLSQDKTST